MSAIKDRLKDLIRVTPKERVELSDYYKRQRESISKLEKDLETNKLSGNFPEILYPDALKKIHEANAILKYFKETLDIMGHDRNSLNEVKKTLPKVENQINNIKRDIEGYFYAIDQMSNDLNCIKIYKEYYTSLIHSTSKSIDTLKSQICNTEMEINELDKKKRTISREPENALSLLVRLRDSKKNLKNFKNRLDNKELQKSKYKEKFVDITLKEHDLNITEVLKNKGGIYLFSWNEVPGNDSDRFIEYLRQNFDIICVRMGNIKKCDDDEAINVSCENNSVLLKLNDDKTKAILTINGIRAYEFIVKIENGKKNIYDTCKMGGSKWIIEKFIEVEESDTEFPEKNLGLKKELMIEKDIAERFINESLAIDRSMWLEKGDSEEEILKKEKKEKERLWKLWEPHLKAK